MPVSILLFKQLINLPYIEYNFIDVSTGKIIDSITMADNLSKDEAVISFKTFLRIIKLLVDDGYTLIIKSRHFELPEEIEFNKIVAFEIFENNMIILKYGERTKEMLRHFDDGRKPAWICAEMHKEQGEISKLRSNAINKANKRNPDLIKELLYIEDLIIFLNKAA